MKKILFAFCFSILTSSIFSQYKWDIGANIGAANYLGEIGGKEKNARGFIADIKFSQTRPSLGGFVRYKIRRNIYFRGNLAWNRISGADNLSTNPGRMGRNLSFRNDILEASIIGQYTFFNITDLGRTYRYQNDIRVYVFTGVTGFYHNPEAKYKGSWEKLQPLHTEGQGIIEGVKEYKLFQFAIPMGAGLFFTIGKRYRIGWEFNYRTTFTDYLDDVSTVYPANPSVLGSDLSQALSNRNPELIYTDNTNLPAKENYLYDPINKVNAKRGNPIHNDSYLSTTINVSYVLKSRSKFARTKYRTYFKSKKYSKRIIRAKF
ncbi:MAG: DUF6089 family protein [Bacteroidota bacterium]